MVWAVANEPRGKKQGSVAACCWRWKEAGEVRYEQMVWCPSYRGAHKGVAKRLLGPWQGTGEDVVAGTRARTRCRRGRCWQSGGNLTGRELVQRLSVRRCSRWGGQDAAQRRPRGEGNTPSGGNAGGLRAHERMSQCLGMHAKGDVVLRGLSASRLFVVRCGGQRIWGWFPIARRAKRGGRPTSGPQWRVGPCGSGAERGARAGWVYGSGWVVGGSGPWKNWLFFFPKPFSIQRRNQINSEKNT
jgi:hypothetical protein